MAEPSFSVDDLCETLQEINEKHGLGLSGPLHAGETYGGSRKPRIWCPKCAGGRTRELNFNVRVDDDGYGMTWICGRANNCGWTGGERLKGHPHAPGSGIRPKKVYQRPAPREIAPPPDPLVEHYAQFNISPETLVDLGIHLTTMAMPPEGEDGQPDKKVDPKQWPQRRCISFPYFKDGVLVNLKYKARYKKGKAFKQEYKCEPTLYNIDHVTQEHDTIVFVEGEDDVAAVYEAGYVNCVSIPDGTPPKPKEGTPPRPAVYDPANDNDDRYAPVRDEPKLVRIKRFILAGDDDEAGQRHHAELAWRLGYGRCWVAAWPYGCKDAKDTLARYGRDAVIEAVERATPYPIDGVVTRTDRDELVRFQLGIDDKPILTGIDVVDRHIRLSETGSFSVTTGRPGSGKTSYWLCHAVWLAEQRERDREHDVRLPPFHAVVCSPEMRQKDFYSALCAIRAQQPFRDSRSSVPPMTANEMLEKHLPWVERHFTLVEWTDRTTAPPLRWAMDTCATVIDRTGAKMTLIDPWTNFDIEVGPRDNLVEKTKRALQRLVAFSQTHLTNVVLVAHPMSMKRDREGKFAVPTGYDISGGAAFFNAAEIGVTIHRKDLQNDQTMIQVWKARYARFGRAGEFNMRYAEDCNRFYELLPFEEREASNVVPFGR